MNRSRRLPFVITMLGVLMTLVALPAMGATDSDESGATDTEYVSDTDLEPAIPIPEEPESEVVADWTYRYLIPATLVLVVVVVVATSVRYFTSVVQNRYRTVEE